MKKSVNYLEKQLNDPEFGMIMRYLPFYDDFAVHVHAGNGPWLQYTAVLAQYHFWSGNNMARSYKETGSKCMIPDSKHPEGGYIQFALPLMWSHAEYARALLIREGDWWKSKREE